MSCKKMRAVRSAHQSNARDVSAGAPVIKLDNIGKVYRMYPRPLYRVAEAFLPLGGKKYHQEFHALTDISLAIGRGQTVGIIGKNGSGKSTLLQIVCGILQPTDGNVFVDGRISALLELGAGFNPQFTGRENVYLNCSIMGLKRNEIDACFDDIVSFADIGVFIDQPVKTYSSGMYVRLAFAVAINVKPDILVVDEALSVGDTLFQAKCFAKFKQFQEQGVTILFVTHSMDLIIRYCSSAYLLEKGKLVTSGAPKDVVDRYNRLLVARSSATDGEGAFSGAGPDSGHGVDAGRDTKTRKQQLAELMQASQQHFKLNPDESRYGNGKAEIADVGIYAPDQTSQQSLVQGEFYLFRMDVRLHEAIEDPIYAFTIKDVKGFDISGTNTLYHEIETGLVEAGEVIRISFEHKITLNPGGYLLSFGCAGFENGEYVVYDRRYDLVSFDVISNRSGVGIFDLDSSITISRL